MAYIIVVDDDPMLSLVVARALKAAGHSVLRCENGRKAIEHLTHEDADLLITDILMPEMDGLETMRAAKQLRPQLPILAISGGGSFGPTDYLGIARAFGTTAVLSKPFQVTELVAMVAGLLATKAPS
jgi:CheY-like chemotaxis protein